VASRAVPMGVRATGEAARRAPLRYPRTRTRGQSARQRAGPRRVSRGGARRDRAAAGASHRGGRATDAVMATAARVPPRP
jgi:hypothetical protein